MVTICGENDKSPVPVLSMWTVDEQSVDGQWVFRLELAPVYIGTLNIGVIQRYRFDFGDGCSMEVDGRLELSEDIEEGEIRWLLPGYLFYQAEQSNRVWTIPAEVAMRNA